MRLQRLCCVAGLLLGLLSHVGANPRTVLMDSVTVLRGNDDFAAAAAHLQAWVTQHPGDSASQLLLGQIYADGGNRNVALRVWTQLLQGRPVDVERYRDVAKRLQALGQDESALQILHEGTRRLGGGDPFAWQRAELLLSTGDWIGAARAHQTFLRQEPHRRQLVEHHLASVQDGLPRYCAALGAVGADAGGAERATWVQLLASCWLQAGDANAGLQALHGAADNDDAIVQALFLYASRCETAGHAEVAARAYGSFAQRAKGSPYRAQAQLKQAEMLALAGDVDGALASYRKMSSGNNTQAAEALLRVARLQAQTLDDPAAALKTLSILADNVRNQQVRRQLLSLRADCHLRLGDLPAAAAEWRSLAADPDGRGAAEFGLAEVAFFTARFDTAAAYIDSLVLRQPTHPLANDALGLLLLIDEYGSEGNALAVLARARLLERQGRTEDAVRDRQWLLTHAPAGLRHLSLLESATRQEEGAPTQALALYTQVINDQPDERHAVSAALGRARMLEAMGQPDEALRAYESMVLTAPLDPRSPDARRHITRLRNLLGDTG